MRIEDLPCPCKAHGRHTVGEHEERWGTVLGQRGES